MNITLNQGKDEVQLKEWYEEIRPLYEMLGKKVKDIIEDMLSEGGIQVHSIDFRAKEVDSFVKKAIKDKYTYPQEEIHDLVGIRVITFVKSDVIKVCDVIKPLFKIDNDNSSDKGKELGDNKVGYRSVHYVAELTESRTDLPENKKYKGIKFEIQVRTILEHAWADISHDKDYKFKGVLPVENDIKRRFSLAAATLELLDREFDNISKEIDEYENVLNKETDVGNLKYPIDSISLNILLKRVFSKEIEDGEITPTFNSIEETLIEELELFGLKTIEDIDVLITKTPKGDIINNNNFVGILRYIMIIDNPEKYFNKAWRNGWASIDEPTFKILDKINPNVKDYIIENEIDINKY
ncbi:hypothetical protein NYE67_18520 [Solibacillus sp. FSL W8-0474]|uniref:GTP pyrophosphokinase n=1 Tax=Solibacillus sp. FSL W8-0474 TaxID=2975336 RepID=UPI0030FB1F6B